jgi:uncharacterized protein (DUF608 family)
MGIPCYEPESLMNELLYPEAKLDYKSSKHGVRIKRTHTSPMVRGDAKACSSPLNFTDIELHNLSAETRVITLVWLQENMTGFSLVKKRPGVQDAGFTLQKTVKQQKNTLLDLPCGDQTFIGLQQSSDTPDFGDLKGDLAFGILANDDPNICITRKSTFYSEQSENTLNAALLAERTNDEFDKGIYTGREPLSSALVVKVSLKAGETKNLSFLQVLNFPEINLKSETTWKKYCSYFPAENRLKDIIAYGAKEKVEMQQKINLQALQLLRTVTKSPMFEGVEQNCDKFVTMAMNTLSFNADATVWDTDDRFLVRECADYPFFNSLDVYFYGSFALLWLLPEVDTSTMRYFKEAIMRSDETHRRFFIYNNAPTAKIPSSKYEGPRARKGAVIHDLGSPFDALPDAYDWHNVAEWKDLAPKYNLMLLRNYHFTQDKALLEECWESVQASLAYLMDMIPKGHAMPLTNGTDDTFDNLCSFGITIYCGSLWIAGLRAAAKIAKILGHDEEASAWSAQAELAHRDLHRTLWDQEHQYFHFFSQPFLWDYVQDAALLKERCLTLLSGGSDTIDGINAFVTEGAGITEEQQAAAIAHCEAEGIDLKGTHFRKEKLIRKAHVILTAGEALNKDANVTLHKESDDSFGDPLLADTYLEMMGLQTVSTIEERTAVVKKAYATNFKLNSPHCGYANLVTHDGQPKEAFQAQDVWIGVQHSNAASLLLRGEKEAFQHLMETLYENLYHKSKIPFAAPEGFNCSCAITEEILKPSMGDHASTLIENMKSLGWVFEDGRVTETFPNSEEAFVEALGANLVGEHASEVYRTVQTTGLKYTAGRYFRPGMIFALPMLMSQQA